MWTLDLRSSLPAWRLPAEPTGVRLAFSTRRGGVSLSPYDTLNLGRSTADRVEAVSENRRRLMRALDLDPEHFATAGQVHGRDVREARAPGLHESCDGLWTRKPGLALAVSSADCLPILFTAPGGVGAAHAGWRGTRAGVIEATLAALCGATGTEPRQIEAHLGPCIRDCCYVVGPEVARQFPPESLREADGVLYLSLPAAARRRLEEAGVAPAAISDTGACTACEPSLYFSHRRDHGLTGRHWGIAAWVSPP